MIIDESGKAVDPRTVTNATGKKFIQSLHEMVQVAFAEELDEYNKDETRMRNSTLQHDWIQLSTIINALMARTRQQDDFSTEEIVEYHDLCGDFLAKWIDLAGQKHVTNYIHIVEFGHLVHFFSQQGWEALDQNKIKKVYHNNENHGGDVGGYTKLNQGHIEQVWIFLSR